MANKRHLEDYIDILVESFKRNKNLPYKIKSGSACPSKKKNCRKKHGEIIIKKYDRKEKKFHVFHYTIHDPKPVFDWWQDELKIKEMILNQNKKMSYGKKPLMRLIDIKKTLNHEGRNYLSERIEMRISLKEKEILRIIAKKKGMKISDYIREKLFS